MNKPCALIRYVLIAFWYLVEGVPGFGHHDFLSFHFCLLSLSQAESGLVRVSLCDASTREADGADALQGGRQWPSTTRF